MQAYLAGFANPRRTGAPRPMSQEEEDAYYRRAEAALSKLAWLGAAALPFSALNPGKTTREESNPIGSLLITEAGQWH